MNITQNSNALKIIAFFLVAVILICLFGFTVDGWQIGKTSTEEPDETVDNIPNDEEELPPNEPEIYVPEYIDPLTGIECDLDLSQKRHLAFILDSSSPLYGISYTDVLIEFPIESGYTRLASITNEYSEIGKIGSLAKSKDYISSFVSAFGAIIVADGKDETKSIDYQNIPSDVIDLNINKEYKYTEFNVYTYSNGDLISQGIKNSTLADTYITPPTLPYNFPEFGQDNVTGKSVFNSITIPYSENNVTTLEYNAENNSYAFLKNSAILTDLLNNNQLNFSNCLILFADSITYEDSNGLQMVLKTNEYGTGYFFTEGTASEITWEYSNIGSLTFYDENGNKLTINRGTTYISLVKSSQKNFITLS